jgi:hypothetical protein
MICRGLRNREVLVSKQVRLKGDVRNDSKRKTYWLINPDFFTAYPKWRTNPDFYKKHPDGAYTTSMSFEEMGKAMKQRMNHRKKTPKQGPIKPNEKKLPPPN